MPPTSSPLSPYFAALDLHGTVTLLEHTPLGAGHFLLTLLRFKCASVMLGATVSAVSCLYACWVNRADPDGAGPDGRTPLAAFTKRATFRDATGNSVPEVNCSGPSGGTSPTRGTGRDSKPSRATGYPPMWASHVTAFSPSRKCCHRSRGS